MRGDVHVRFGEERTASMLAPFSHFTRCTLRATWSDGIGPADGNDRRARPRRDPSRRGEV